MEVLHDGSWINLEGFILDAGYLHGVRCLFPEARGDFCGYAIGTPKIEAPPVEWTGGDTYIQNTGIDHDFAVFDSPDAFYEKHGANLSGLRRLLFVWMVRHMMNATIGRSLCPSVARAVSRLVDLRLTWRCGIRIQSPRLVMSTS